MALIDIEGLKNGKIKLNEITIEMLIADAVERGSEEGLNYLNEQYYSKTTRKGKEIKKPISSYRKTYLEKYAGYKKKAKYNPENAKKYFAKRKEKENARINSLFSEAIQKLHK